MNNKTVITCGITVDTTQQCKKEITDKHSNMAESVFDWKKSNKRWYCLYEFKNMSNVKEK